jgi:response regulator RpfG family c-di-GMP phosphodiesterase
LGSSVLEAAEARPSYVLIVTGSSRTGERLSGELRRAAYQPLLVPDGRSALRAAVKLPPSLVVVDQKLADMGASVLVRALRRLPRLGRLPAISVGSGSDGEAIDASCAKTLPRQFDSLQLLEAVAQAIDADSGGRENGAKHVADLNERDVAGDPDGGEPRPAMPSFVELQRLRRENAVLQERLADRSVELAFLAGFGVGISSGAGAAGPMDEVLQRCAEVIGFEFGAAYLAASHRPPVLQGHVGFANADQLRDFFGDPRLLAEAIAIAGEGIVRLPSAHLDRPRSRAVLARAKLKMLLVAPVLEADELLGVLVLGSSCATTSASQDVMISAIAGQMGQWLSRVRNLSAVSRSQRRTLERLARAAEFRDEETANHTQRVSRYSELLADLSGVDQERSELIATASAMHDIGKLGIPDSILLKPGRLTAKQRKHMQKHADYGRKILAGESDPLLELASVIAWTHHERWDGAGYPRRLRGEDIPLEGRIVAIGDVFDALTSDRVYRPAMTVENAVDLMREDSGAHFDPDLLDLFMGAMPRVLEIRRRLPDGADTAMAQRATA